MSLCGGVGEGVHLWICPAVNKRSSNCVPALIGMSCITPVHHATILACAHRPPCHVACYLLQELYYRHLYARTQPSLRARCESWDNYCDLFGVILHGRWLNASCLLTCVSITQRQQQQLWQ